jgi:hypothetical protein
LCCLLIRAVPTHPIIASLNTILFRCKYSALFRASQERCVVSLSSDVYFSGSVWRLERQPREGPGSLKSVLFLGHSVSLREGGVPSPGIFYTVLVLFRSLYAWAGGREDRWGQIMWPSSQQNQTPMLTDLTFCLWLAPGEGCDLSSFWVSAGILVRHYTRCGTHLGSLSNVGTGCPYLEMTQQGSPGRVKSVHYTIHHVQTCLPRGRYNCHCVQCP